MDVWQSDNGQVTLYYGDCLEVLPTLADNSVHCAVTSPPYFGLRDYGTRGQLGHEPVSDCLGWATGHPCGECYVCHMVAVFREVRRVLRHDGVCWLNLGDSYAGSGRGPTGRNGIGNQERRQGFRGSGAKVPDGLKPKDLMGIPWRVALALQADGWWLRQEIIWAKGLSGALQRDEWQGNPMPESVKDRCTRAHESVFLLTKNARYFWNYEAMQEPCALSGMERAKSEPVFGGNKAKGYGTRIHSGNAYFGKATRNRRSVWTVSPSNYRGGHFATFPPDLIRPMILASCPKNGIVLDPFAGAGTTGVVAVEEQRNAILIELSLEYGQKHIIPRIEATLMQRPLF